MKIKNAMDLHTMHSKIFESCRATLAADFNAYESQLNASTFRTYRFIRTTYPKGVIDTRDGNFLSTQSHRRIRCGASCIAVEMKN